MSFSFFFSELQCLDVRMCCFLMSTWLFGISQSFFSWCGDVTIKLYAFYFRAFILHCKCTVFFIPKEQRLAWGNGNKCVHVSVCVFLSILGNRKHGLCLEMNSDGSVRGSPVMKRNCKQLLKTWVNKHSLL